MRRTSLLLCGLALTACGAEEAAEVSTIPVQGALIDSGVPEPKESVDGLGYGEARVVGPDILDPGRLPTAEEVAAISGLGDHAPSGDVDLKSKEVLRFSDLALGAEKVNDLLDAMTAIDEFPTEPFVFPEPIQELDGEDITILGYMIPTRWEGAKVQSFMLVGDLLSCCFGGSPQADQWIDVKMADEGTKYLPYMPVIVKGTFGITSEMPESGYFIGVYQMEATSVERKD